MNKLAKFLILALLVTTSLMFSAQPAKAAVTRVQSKSGGGDFITSLGLAMPSSLTAGNTVIVAITSYYNDAANAPQSYSVSDGTNTYTRVVNYQAGQGAYEIWYASNVASASTVTVSSGIGAYFEGIAVEYSGLLSSSSFDQSQQNQVVSGGGTYTSNATAATAQADELLFGVFSTYATTPTITPDSPWSSIFDSAHNSFHSGAVSDQIVSSTGTYSFTGSISGTATKDTAVIATFKAAGGGGGGTTTTRRRIIIN